MNLNENVQRGKWNNDLVAEESENYIPLSNTAITSNTGIRASRP